MGLLSSSQPNDSVNAVPCPLLTPIYCYSQSPSSTGIFLFVSFAIYRQLVVVSQRRSISTRELPVLAPVHPSLARSSYLVFLFAYTHQSYSIRASAFSVACFIFYLASLPPAEPHSKSRPKHRAPSPSRACQFFKMSCTFGPIADGYSALRSTLTSSPILSPALRSNLYNIYPSPISPIPKTRR